jgi:hypothetical protein
VVGTQAAGRRLWARLLAPGIRGPTYADERQIAMILLIPSQDEERGLPALRANEQAALRRVATLVARDVPPGESSRR